MMQDGKLHRAEGKEHRVKIRCWMQDTQIIDH
jgi:hypothetical protein